MTGNDIVDFAINEIGNKGKKYCSWYGYSTVVDWCMIFVSYVFVKCKCKKLIGGKSYINVGVFDDEMDALKVKKIKDHTKAEKGDICIYSWNGTQRQHVGIVYKTSKNYIYTIEGNTGSADCNKSKVKKRKRSKKYIYRIYRPAYTMSFSDMVNGYLAGTYLTDDPEVIKKAAEINELANQVLKNKYGTGSERKKKLGSNYTLVQNEINRRLKYE